MSKQRGHKHKFRNKRRTEAEETMARDRRKREPEASDKREPASRNRAAGAAEGQPFYDEDLHELRVGDRVVKCFTQESDAQEVIVKAFQEENWCQCIDDPLTGKAGQEPKERLRMAVANLNRRQRMLLLHFRVIRQGTGVGWEFHDASDSRATQERQ
jgi:hypothetical protein